MSGTAKFLTILMLLLSAAYAAVSASLFAKRQDFKGKYESAMVEKAGLEKTLRGEIAALESKSRDLDRQRQEGQREIATLKTALTREEASNKRLDGQLKSSESERERLVTATEDFAARLKHEEQVRAKLRKEADDLNDQLTKERATVVARNEELDKLKLAKADVDRELVSKNEELTETKGKLQGTEETLTRLAKEGVEVDPRASKTVTGQVINMEGSVVVINRGRDHGVLVGSMYTIYSIDRGGYIGKMRIRQVEKDLAYGSPVKPVTIQPIRVGDQVSNKISSN